MVEQTVGQTQRADDSQGLSGQRRDGSDAVNICLLGASFDTGNLGVSALAESSIKCIMAKWPTANVTLFASGRDKGTHTLPVHGRDVLVHRAPVRFCKNIFMSNHYGLLFLYALVARLLPFVGLRRGLAGRNATFRILAEADLFIDIAGGDSFSDIYGIRRLLLASLIRILPLMLKKNLVMFPQTYGPFARRLSRCLARFVLKRTKRIYARDRVGLEYVQELMGSKETDDRIRFAPDVAFILDPRKPGELDIGGLEAVRSDTSVVIGLNVSGLIYHGGYTGQNQFGLSVDYRELIDKLISCLLSQPDTLILLVPHVIPPGSGGGGTENDLLACRETRERCQAGFPNRLFLTDGRYDQGQIKHIVGMTDFFIGTRMHSCIAALSQGIPAVGLAYSKKFKGVFETVGAQDAVADMRSMSVEQIVTLADHAFAARRETAERLKETLPAVKKQIMSILDGIDL